MVSESYDSYIGKRIGTYTILCKLGGGGSAHVYLAQNKYNDLVAVKLLDPKYLKSKIQQHFLQEAQFLQELIYNHYVLPVLDYGESEGIPYIVVEYAPGGTLREYINNLHRITINEVLSILTQVGEAINAAHQHNIVHCDLKPENILFNKKSNAILADFGIAVRLNANKKFYGHPRGTYAYMAPEQFDGIFAKEGDQYSLGCIAYELLTGRHPFEYLHPFNPHDRENMQKRHQNAECQSLSELNGDLSENIEKTILQALAKKPSERHTSINSFIRLLRLPTSSTTRQLHNIARSIHTSSTNTSAQEEAQHPTTDPSRNPNSSSINLDVCYEIIQPKAYSSRVMHNSRQFYPPIPFFPKNANRDQPKNTDYSQTIISGNAHERSEEITQSKSRDPIKALQDLRLCQNHDLRVQLASILVNFHLELTEEIVTDLYTGAERQCTMVKVIGSKHPVSHYYILYIPRQFLTVSQKYTAKTQLNIAAIRDLGSAFPEKSTLIILSDRKEALDLEIHSIITKQWKKQQIEASFIPQIHVQSVQKKNREFQKQWLTEDMYLYEALKDVNMSKSVQQMEANDIETLVTIIYQRLLQYTDEAVRGWRILLQEAGLDAIAGEIDLKGPPKTIARELVEYLKIRARLPQERNCDVLGLLFLHILVLNGVLQKDKASIRDILKKYRLVPPERIF